MNQQYKKKQQSQFAGESSINEYYLMIAHSIELCIIDVYKFCPRNELRKLLHKHWFKIVTRDIKNVTFKRRSIRNIIDIILDDKIQSISYSFSYIHNTGVYCYSHLYDVGVDIVNPSQLESVEKCFFKIPDSVYNLFQISDFSTKVISWGIQEAISKLERTGLGKKYTIIDAQKLDLACNDIKLIYITEENKINKCNVVVLNNNNRCIIVVYRQRYNLMEG